MSIAERNTTPAAERSRRAFIFVCGILTFPGGARNWTGRAVTYTHGQGLARGRYWVAEKVEYLTGAIFRAFKQNKRVQKLALTLDFYQGWPITLVGHSNGADVCVRCLRENKNLHIDCLHLVSGATDCDFNSNGLNRLLAEGAVGRVFVYMAGQDGALALADTIAGRFLGYGALGRRGPVNVLPSVAKNVVVKSDFPWSGYGHSTCFEDERFEHTIENFYQF